MKTTLYKVLVIIVICLLQCVLLEGQNEPEGTALPDDSVWLSTVPRLVITPQSLLTPLPTEVDNIHFPYFPHHPGYLSPPFFYDQKTAGSCVSSSLVYYCYTYEFNRAMNDSANSLDRIFAPNFNYNFVNGGVNGATFAEDVLGLMKGSGGLSFNQWGSDDPLEYIKWLSGYDYYIYGVQHKISSYCYSAIHNSESLDTLKHWLSDHGEGSSIGGLASFGIYWKDDTASNLLPPSAHANGLDQIYTKFNKSTAHMMTFVGYSDSVGWDFNGNDTIDPNTGDMSTWEWGALKVANSGGDGCFNTGYIWIPYRYFTRFHWGVPTIYFCLTPEIGQSPSLVIKSKFLATRRGLFDIQFNFGETACDQPPPQDEWNYPLSFHMSGGDHPMDGYDSIPVEWITDIGQYLDSVPFGKIFVKTKGGRASSDTLYSMSLVDYRWGETFELPFQFDQPLPIPLTPVPLPAFQWGFQYWPLEYDLLPFTMNENKTFLCNKVSRFSPTVDNNSTLTLGNGIRVDMYNSYIDIAEGSTLILGDSVTIVGKRGTNMLIIDGNIQVGSGVKFTTSDDATLSVLINGTCNGVALNNVIFDGVSLQNYCQSLTATNCTFRKNFNFVDSESGNITFSGCTFDNYSLWLFNDDNPQNVATISNCSFVARGNNPTAIDMYGYDKFYIENNTIDSCGIGIALSVCGFGDPGTHLIQNNVIQNCDPGIGISVNNSIADIRVNHIRNNNTGIGLYDHSQSTIMGDRSALSSAQTQEIRDNSGLELYASFGSYPKVMRYNCIIDEDNIGNPSDPMVFYDYHPQGTVIYLNAQYNCWGSNFKYDQDLYPALAYKYNPMWCPLFITHEGPTEDEALFENAVSEFDSGDYYTAKTDFHSVIEQYPKSPFAGESIKELYLLEKFVGSDYSQLKNYYSSNDSIVSDTVLTVLGAFFANKCDTKLGNWTEAIEYNEDRIINPSSFQDSIFGIIDLGYVYLQMGNTGNKATYTGSLPQYKPNSLVEHKVTEKKLLALLPGDNPQVGSIKRLDGLSGNKLISNQPNPFSSSTTLYYRLSEPGTVVIRVYDMLGRERIVITNQEMKSGVYKAEIQASSLSPGMYNYTLEVNGKIIDKNKMIVIR